MPGTSLWIGNSGALACAATKGQEQLELKAGVARRLYAAALGFSSKS